MKIPFNKPCYFGSETEYINKAIKARKFSGNGEFNVLCQKILEEKTGCKKALIVSSATHALEMAAMLLGVRSGDEVIIPSFGFSSTANAFVLRGAKIIFVDIRPDTLNIDENLIEAAISKKTRVIVVTHYAGIACEMSKILKIGRKYKIDIVEDAAHAIGAKYKDKFLGTLGTFGCLSFHETKNVQCGEGGALLINQAKYYNQAEIIREKGTDRSRFHRGEINKYTWRDIGSSYLLSELAAAYLLAQLKGMEKINKNRFRSWNLYYKLLKPLEKSGNLGLPQIPADCQHNGHIFYIKPNNLYQKGKLRKYLDQRGVEAVFHYLPLHKSIAGRKFGQFSGRDRFTTNESQCLLRLPLYYQIDKGDIMQVVRVIYSYFGQKMSLK